MRRFGGLILCFALAGCQLLGGKKTQSSWIVLERAASAECAKWPMAPKDLSINDVRVVRGKKLGFVATGVNRSGTPVHYYLPFDGGLSFDDEDLVPLKIGRGSLLAGGSTLGDVAVGGVVLNLKDKASFEVRNLRDNVVRFKTELVAAGVQDAWMTPAQNGQWLSFKTDDNEFGAAFVNTTKKTALASKINGAKFKETPVIVPAGSAALAVWREGETGKPFKARMIGEDGNAGTPYALDAAVESQAESWSAAHHAGSYYLAAIDGDSLVGQANLRVSAFSFGDGGGDVKWTKDLPLKDVHVTEPVFFSSGGRLQILVLKWVDEESTIARYNVAGGTVGQPTYSGIFPKGSRIVDAFAGEDADDAYVVVRNKEETRWTFQVCRL